MRILCAPRTLCVTLGAIGLVSCAGKASAPLVPPPVPPPVSTAIVRTAGSPIIIVPARLGLAGKGAASARPVVVTEDGYTGAFHERSTCAHVAVARPASGKGPVFRVRVVGVGYGRCKITFTDAGKNARVLPVSDGPAGAFAFRLNVPVKPPDARHGPRPAASRLRRHYVSPSTQAMSVAIVGPTSEAIVSGLTDESSACQVTLDGLTCAFSVPLQACSDASNCYTATVTTYDAYDPSTGTIPPGAAALSIAQQSFNVSGGSTETVGFAFSGIPEQIAVVPASALTALSGSVLDVIGPGAHSLYAEALDADGNPIAGSGGPNYAVAASGALPLTLAQPPEGAPRFSVTPPSTYQRSVGTLTIQATYPSGAIDGCTQPGAVCSAAVTVEMQSLLAVSNGGNGGNGTVSYYAAEKGLGPLLTISSVSGPSALVFDGAGTLYIASAGANSVTLYALGSTVAGTQITAGISGPTALAFDGAGNLWVLNSGNATVTTYPPGATSPSATLDVAANPTAMAIDSSGDVWVSTSTQVWQYLHGGASSTLSGIGVPNGIAWSENTLFVQDPSTPPSSPRYPGPEMEIFTNGSTSPTNYIGSNGVGILTVGTDQYVYQAPTPGSVYGAAYDPQNLAGAGAVGIYGYGGTNLSGNTAAQAVDDAGTIVLALDLPDSFGRVDVFVLGDNSAPVLSFSSLLSAPNAMAIAP